MSTLERRLSLSKAKRLFEKMDGIEVLALSLDRPISLSWYRGQLNHLDSRIPCSYLPVAAPTSHLAALLQSQTEDERKFITIDLQVLPVYVTFRVHSFEDFLTSFYREVPSRDMTLFFQDGHKVLDIHLAEEELEIRLLNKP